MHNLHSLVKSVFPIRNVVIGVLLLTSWMFAACGEVQQVVEIHPSWAGGGDSLNAYKQQSDVIAYGTFTGEQKTSKTDYGLTVTDSDFRINEVIYDPKNMLQATNTLAIWQGGGVLDNKKYVVEEDPLFSKGEQSILFLRMPVPGRAYVISGPGGRFTVKNGKIESSKHHNFKIASDLSKDAFVKAIKEQPLIPLSKPAEDPSPKIIESQSVNIVELSSLKKTDSIVVKELNGNKSITEPARVQAVIGALDKPVLALATSYQAYNTQANEVMYVVFVFKDGSYVGFEYDRNSGILTGRSPNFVRVSLPVGVLDKALGLT